MRNEIWTFKDYNECVKWLKPVGNYNHLPSF